MNKRKAFTLVFILIFLSTSMLMAQDPPPPPDGGGDSGPGNVDDISITAFLWVLGLAGAYLGFNKSK